MTENKAYLYSAVEPTEEQKQRFIRFLERKYGENTRLVWVEDKSVKTGFRLEADADIYDWTDKGRLNQFKDAIFNLTRSENIIPLIKDTVASWIPKAIAEEIGTVITVGDGIATVSDLPNVTYGEILMFENGSRGMVQNLDEDNVGCIIFDDDNEIHTGSKARRTGKTAGIPVGEAYLGRVVNALGVPIDGKGEIKAVDYYPIEKPAPSIVDRQSVHEPLETGILAIDSMFPIGKGQRELIIGDRQTGKTAIAVDTILNQKGKNVICVYVAIGQKVSSVKGLYENLLKRGAMEYTVIVNASASDSVPMQYIAPYSACSIAEYFTQQGRDVLIVYDDLSKHAIAYRALSLLLERSPGREAYPGDVFYLHSRLLERSACMSSEKGGGSITALPIVETQAGDVSAYISTNIISITDGQIFLETGLFASGQRPAVNVGLSVSRVGGAAQTKAMKKATGTLKLDLAQYREMEVFTQFASDLDDTTKSLLRYGQGLMRLLRQAQYEPKKQYRQVIILTAALAKIFCEVDIEKITDKAKALVEYFEKNHNDLCMRIKDTGLLSDEDRDFIISKSRDFVKGA